MVDSGKIPHAMMFYENDGCGAFAIVQAFLQYVFCGGDVDESPGAHRVAKLIHPDVKYVYPVNLGAYTTNKKRSDITSVFYIEHFRKLAMANPYFLEDDLNDAFQLQGRTGGIAVNDAKEIMEEIYLSPVEGGYKAVVIYLPELMNAPCANKLLKSIEEPPQKTLFLMITHNPDKVIQTISSRCQHFRVVPQSKAEITSALQNSFGIDGEEAASLAQQAYGSIGKALWLTREDSERSQFIDMFNELMDAVAKRDFVMALGVADELIALDNKEKQKAFLEFMGEEIRKIFLCKQGLESISAIPSQEIPHYQNLAKVFHVRFCSHVLKALDQVNLLYARNVNPKLLVTDFVNRVFMSI